MSLLYPLMALGLAAAAVPIWLHLRRRDETNLVEFSSLRFLDDQPLARTRPLWPQNWPLLLLRLLGLAALVAAFCWPYFEDEDVVVVEESRVYILDNTLSHQVDNGFVRDRERIADELAQGEMRTQIGVIELSSTARTLVRFGDDKDAAAAKLRELEPKAERGVFIDAFRSAGEMLGTSLGQQRRIVLLSDSQANQWTVGAESPPFLDDVEVVLPDPMETPSGNLSLSGSIAQRVIRDGEHWVEAGVFLQSQGVIEAEGIVFRSNGSEVAREKLERSETPAEPSDRATSVSRTVATTWQVDPDEWVLCEASIVGGGDALTGDDRVVFSLPPVSLGRVEVVGDSVYLRRALNPEVMSGRWDVQFSEPSQFSDLGHLQARDGDSPPDVLCVESGLLASTGVRDAIRDDLSRGRGVMLILEENSPLISGFLRDLGIELESPQPSIADPSTFRYIFGEHPIFAPFRSGELGNLAEVRFSDYRRLSFRDAAPLAFSASGDPLLFEANVTPGRMLVLAFAFDRRDTNWPIHPTFIPFLDKCLNFLRSKTITAAAYEPGESVVYELPGGTEAERLTVSLIDPATRVEVADGPAPIKAEVVDRKANFQLPGRAGHYAVRFGDSDKLAAVLDVNPSPLESQLAYENDPAAIRAWKREAPVDGGETAADEAELKMTSREALQQEYWWYLLVAAAFAFLIETICSARLARAS